MIKLEAEMTFVLEVTGPLMPKDEAPDEPAHRFWEMTRATLEGPRIKATMPLKGIDWFSPARNGYGRPHVRMPFQTDDGALILLEYSGLVHASDAFARAVEQDQSTDWTDQYMRMALHFETTSSRYQWLAQHLFLARGRLLAARQIEYDVYRVD